MFRLKVSLLFLVLIGLCISKDMPQVESRFLSGKAMRVKRHIEAVTIGKYSFTFSYIYVTIYAAISDSVIFLSLKYLRDDCGSPFIK